MCVLCKKASSLLWSDGFLLVLEFDITRTQTHTHTDRQKDTKHSGTIGLTHAYEYIFTLPVMYLQQLSLY